MRILFGSRNPSKYARMRQLFGVLGIDLIGVRNLGLEVVEPAEGDDIEANAILKAMAYARAAAMPCIANDYGLQLDGLPADEQPAARMHRHAGSAGPVSDAEMMAFYVERIRALGGSTIGTWTGALALAFDDNHVVATVASHRRTFVSQPSAVVLPGEPLASLQIEPATGRYLSEVAFDARASRPSPIDTAFLTFIEKHLEQLRNFVGLGNTKAR
jgi:inosine/xanthosine triphosphate pyrophosphatase family protein